LAFWNELSGDPELEALRDWTATNSPFDAATAAAAGAIHTIFSPRHGLKPLTWYAGEFVDTATVSGHVTMPFGMTKTFEAKLTPYAGQALHFVLLDERDSNQDVWSKNRHVVLAVGSQGGPDTLARWAKEQLTGFNVHVPYLHTKILLVDPLSAAPTVITGSA